MSTSAINRLLFALSLCALALGKCIETDSNHSDDVMTDGDVQHRTALSKRAADKVPCQPLPRATLEKIMGAAFNPRYMSIEKPEIEALLREALPAGQHDQGYPKKKRPPVEAFHVHQGFTRILHEEPIANYFKNQVQDSVKGQDYQYKIGEDSEDRPGFAVTEAPPMSYRATTGGHHKRHHHSRKTSNGKTQDGHTGQFAESGHSGQPVENGKKSHTNKKGQPEPNTNHDQTGQRASLERFKMDDFEQGEPPAEPAIELPSLTVGQPEEKASEKFVKHVRAKRTVKKGFPWACESRIEWIDLGPNHFPRFLRSVVCTNEKCWFGHFQCRPKAFTVKVLRRRKDSCSSEDVQPEEVMDDGIKDENSYVPQEFREQWVFEERAVTFCCECAA